MGIAEGIMLGVLAGCSAYDLKYRKIPVAAVALLCGGVSGYRFITGTGFLELLCGLLPGVLLLLFAFVTRESIGTGDGLVLCALGMFCGAKTALAVLGMALVLASVLAMVLLVLRRAGRKTELPFLPCLWGGYLLSLLW